MRRQQLGAPAIVEICNKATAHGDRTPVAIKAMDLCWVSGIPYQLKLCPSAIRQDGGEFMDSGVQTRYNAFKIGEPKVNLKGKERSMTPKRRVENI